MTLPLSRLLPRRFRVANALRELQPVFELLCTLPKMADAESEELHGLHMHGRMQARKRKRQFSSLDPHYVTTLLLHKLKRAKQQGNMHAHGTLIAIWKALEAEGVAVSVPEWLRIEFGLEVAVRDMEWVKVRWPV